MKHRLPALASLVSLGALGACADAPTGVSANTPALATAPGSRAATSYLVIAQGNDLPATLAAQARAAGGALTRTMPEIGTAVAFSRDPEFAAKLARAAGVRAVVPNPTIRWRSGPTGPAGAAAPARLTAEEASAVVHPPNSTENDVLFNYQWGHTAVRAQEAWALGFRGKGVRVAVLDDGIDPNHVDIKPNLNTALSTSFIDGETYFAPAGTGEHGTHVAGTIAAADNGIGVIGVAPEAELVSVKVLASTGSGTFGALVNGLVYAGQIGADVANMSLGAYLPRGTYRYMDDNGTPKDPSDDFEVTLNGRVWQEILVPLTRAAGYAAQRGVTLIASAGNDGVDLDHDQSWVSIPAQTPHVVAVSALGPNGWSKNPATSLDLLASYSNFGQSAIGLSAPGGNWDVYFAAPGAQCTLLGRTRDCYVFDGVLSSVPGSWAWYFGTSMAAPHVSGVAALVVGKNGGSMAPAQVLGALHRGADDLGKPGNDDVHGAGRVNALNALR